MSIIADEIFHDELIFGDDTLVCENKSIKK